MSDVTLSCERFVARLERLAHAPMAMRPDAMRSLAARIIAMEDFEDPPELAAVLVESPSAVAEEAKVPRLAKVKGAVAVIPVYGTIAQHRGSDYWGGVFTEELVGKVGEMVQAPNVGAVVLSFDSPGGIVYGVDEASDAIRQMGQVKPIFGHVKAEAASAAYYLASNTTKLFAQPSSEVGSIGVWTMHIDASKAFEEYGWDITLISAGKYKVEGHPFGPLEEDGKAELQRSVDRYYDSFLGSVAAGRGVTKGTVKSDFGEGRMLDAERAKSAGMVDGICTLGELLAGVMAPPESGRRRSMGTRIALADSWSPEIDGVVAGEGDE